MDTKIVHNAQFRQQWLFDLRVKDPSLSWTECHRKWKVKFSEYTEVTYNKDWKKVLPKFNKLQAEIQEAKQKAIITESVKIAKKDIKQKYDRIIILQDIVDSTLNELSLGKATETVYRNGRAEQFERKLTVSEKVQLSRAIKDIQAEISRLENDYDAITQEGIKEMLDIETLPKVTREQLIAHIKTSYTQ